MKRPNITPGPWTHSKGVTPCIQATLDRHQITVAKTIYGSHDEALANARAIAALPDLLAALEGALDYLAILNPAFVPDNQRADYATARAALQKAGYEF